jgi:hypothetical protein
MLLTGCAPAAGAPPRQAAPIVTDDAGDARVTTTYDGRMVRRRVAVAIHPVAGASTGTLRSQLAAAAASEHLGPLTDAWFAVFSPGLLRYLVPELTVVLPERARVADAEILMRDHTYPGLGYYIVQPVLLHELAFAVPVPSERVAAVRVAVDREGVLTDSLGRYVSEQRDGGLVVKYAGPVLSDGEILAVRRSIGRAAAVEPARVIVTAMHPSGGVDLSGEPAEPPEPGHH